MCWGEVEDIMDWVGVISIYIWFCDTELLVLVCCWNIGHVQWREEWPIERLVAVMVVGGGGSGSSSSVVLLLQWGCETWYW